MRSHLVPRLALAAQFLLAAALGADLPASQPMTIHRLQGGPRYGLIGNPTGRPAPTLFVFAAGLETMQSEPVFTEVCRLLLAHGFLSVVLDPPGHGEDVRPGETEGLTAWRTRLDGGVNFVAPFTAGASAVLDELVRLGLADPARVAACGTSRGGFLAFQFAASDPRIAAAGGISPVADLMALTEFRGTPRRLDAEALSLVAIAPKLAGRPLWISIGNHDTRVDTDSVIAFARAAARVDAEGKKANAVVPVYLIVAPSAGHTKIDGAHERLAEWLLDTFRMPR